MTIKDKCLSIWSHNGELFSARLLWLLCTALESVCICCSQGGTVTYRGTRHVRISAFYKAGRSAFSPSTTLIQSL